MTSDASIFVVGADTDVRNQIAAALEGACSVEYAASRDEALGRAVDHFDVVICDSTLAQINGFELLQQWSVAGAATPVVVLVNRSEVRPAADAMRHGAADCIEKPIDEGELRMVVSRLLGAGGATSRRSGSGGMGRGIDSRPHLVIPPNTSLEDLERAAVEQALVQHSGNRTHAARALGISVRTLQRKLKAWGLPVGPRSAGGADEGPMSPGAAPSRHYPFS